MTKHHTPGPWEAHQQLLEPWAIWSELDRPICLLTQHNPDAREDARLIASAPEMLEVLKYIASLYEHPDLIEGRAKDHPGLCFVEREMMNKVHAVISKAEGGDDRH